MPRPEPTWVYHFTRVEHLASIIEHGLMCDSRAHEPGVLQIEVGNTGIKQARARRVVPVAPGGVVADYVPFYYAPRSPMLHAIHKGNVDSYQQGCDRLIFLATTTQALRAMSLQVLGTDRNARMAVAEFSADDEHIGAMTRWDVMELKYWGDAEHGSELRQAECLVYGAVSARAIQLIASKSQTVREEVTDVLASMGVNWVQTAVRPDWYF